MMRRWFEEKAWVLDLIEIIGILAILALILNQTAILSAPALLAGVGALYIALLGAGRRLMTQRRREEEREEERERERKKRERERAREWRERRRAAEMGLPPEESDSQTVVYNMYGENAYIDARPERRERSDRALDHTPVEERAARNRNLDDFEPERTESRRPEEEEEPDDRDTIRFVHEEDPEKEREREFELERE
ncbi:hypothetical protein [Salinirubrum litoreum]|uniref:Uncharacterized protein n=1 Tax=Salinirubrum litoreum TaxID=1126234 RepID=A0ABD5R8C2_9EURY|nr:hypothetical protein [Salinirubrum litoreum]